MIQSMYIKRGQKEVISNDIIEEDSLAKIRLIFKNIEIAYIIGNINVSNYRILKIEQKSQKYQQENCVTNMEQNLGQ